ncbi:MAG: hypothetical protein QM729_19660 [Solirubrobacterales bacterium]
MSVREVSLDPGDWGAAGAELKELRKETVPVVLGVARRGDPGTSPLTLDVGGVTSVLRGVERMPGPVVLALDGMLGASELALACACAVTCLGPGGGIGAIGAADALALGLAGRLTARVGAAGAARLLLDSADPSRIAAGITLGLMRPAADPLAEARAAAARLDDPATRLLLRSLAFAARGTPAQAAAYDTELLALLDPYDEPQTDRPERPR